MSETKADYYAKHLGQLQREADPLTNPELTPPTKQWDTRPGGVTKLRNEHGNAVKWSQVNTILADVDAAIEPIQSSGLPTLLAQLVNEFRGALADVTDHDKETLIYQFNGALVVAAQPLLTKYLEQLTTPPQFVVKATDEDVSERRKTSMYGAYLLQCRERDLVPFSYGEWCNIGDGPKTKGNK